MAYMTIPDQKLLGFSPLSRSQSPQIQSLVFHIVKTFNSFFHVLTDFKSYVLSKIHFLRLYVFFLPLLSQNRACEIHDQRENEMINQVCETCLPASKLKTIERAKQQRSIVKTIPTLQTLYLCI